MSKQIKKMEKNKKRITMGDLARMVQQGFLGLEEKIKESKDELKSDILNVRADINKKVDVFRHNDLEYRVEKLEEKVGIARKK
jgi:hypothetical protein